MTARKDLLGVASIVRALGLEAACYGRLLDFFHSPALDLDKLTRAWCGLVFRVHPGILRVNGRSVLIADGIKAAKSGRKMPGVKKLHQQSESNTKPEYIFGHSCQAIAVLTQALSSVFALPLVCRIQEGVVFSNRDQRTLLDKMVLLIGSLGLKEPFYFVADAYYATGNIVRGLLAQKNHLVPRVKSNSVAFFPATPPPPNRLQEAPSPVYGEKGVRLRFRAADLLWRPVGILVRFVAVHHPRRGAILLMCTDLTLSPLDIIRIYGLRFKIEVSFQAGPPGHRRVCLSLLDGGHDATTARQRQPAPAPQIGCPAQRAPATPSAEESRPAIATSNSGSSPRACFRSSPRRHPSWPGDSSAPGSGPFGQDWPPPNRSLPSPSGIPSRNFSQLPPKPQSS
jgi:hypothetical protein